MEKWAVFELWHFCWSQKYFFAFETNKSVITYILITNMPQTHEILKDNLDLFWVQSLKS